MAKIERLLTLMNALLGAPRPVTRRRAARAGCPGYPDEDNSFKRAFERDKDDLREMGVPLLVETVPGTDPPLLGYRIRKQDYELRDPGLEPDELEALNLAAAVTGFDGGIGQRALFKLGGAAPAPSPQAELPPTPTWWPRSPAWPSAGSIALRATTTSTATVHPYRLEFLRGRWYLNGFDHVRDEERWYRMSRIEGGDRGRRASPARSSARSRRCPASSSTRGCSAARPRPGRPPEVWFDPEVAATVRAELADAAVERDDADGLVVALTVTNREGFRSWLLGFLDRAEVLEPPELRATRSSSGSRTSSPREAAR